ncbi:DNA-deoxyinosine glycosylase [Variovorax defluvii]|uniref:DNA-deoxyinosine glycosylase n=1 Tax=Variovorax defluvii TaxID=913761 RepID=A0ABP8GZY8_9BURK
MTARRPIAQPQQPRILTGLAPVVSEATVVLILGSFPSVRSLAQRQYYAHPQNQFWRILQALWPHDALPMEPDSYEKRSGWLLAHGLGLWDVYGQCTRSGSLDAAIRDAVPNDIAALRLPALAAVAHNGGESFKHARHTRGLGVPVHRLPSTSPAHASWDLERKVAAWREVIGQYLPVQAPVMPSGQ